jgi:aryl-alcohol dehydrogenase-like predicted oxidoreductase
VRIRGREHRGIFDAGQRPVDRQVRPPQATGRVADQLDAPRHQGALQVATRLGAVAERLGQPPAAVAIAYALANPLVASVLFGATSPEQVRQNAQALPVGEQLSAPVLSELRAL